MEIRITNKILFVRFFIWYTFKVRSMKSRENVYYLFWIFIIGCVVGWCIEGVFSLIKWKEFINHSAVVIGPFNAAYGLGALVLTALLFKF
mgnify:CR=1 FL=1